MMRAYIRADKMEGCLLRLTVRRVMEILLLLLAFTALSSAFPPELHIEKRSPDDSDSERPNLYQV